MERREIIVGVRGADAALDSGAASGEPASMAGERACSSARRASTGSTTAAGNSSTNAEGGAHASPGWSQRVARRARGLVSRARSTIVPRYCAGTATERQPARSAVMSAR